MIPLAHAGHWLPQLLYLAPVVAVVVAVVVGRIKERRRGATHHNEVSEATKNRSGA